MPKGHVSMKQSTKSKGTAMPSHLKQCPQCCQVMNKARKFCVGCNHQFYESKPKSGASYRGKLNSQARLTADDVRAIRKRYQEPRYTKSGALQRKSNMQELIDEFKVSRRHIQGIISGTVWSWLD